MGASDPDIVVSVPWRWVPSPNHGGERTRTLGVVIHSTRGGSTSLETDYQATVRYCSRDNPAEVGPTWVVGPAQVTRMIQDRYICYGQTVDNDTHLGIEVAQPTPTTPYVEFQYQATAEICARYCLKYGFPPTYIGKQYTENVERPGILGHEDTKAGWSRGKTDPGDMWNWSHFCQLLEAKVKALKGGGTTLAMTADEKAKLGECADHVYDANRRLSEIVTAAEAALGPLPVLEQVKGISGELHTWGVHTVKQIAGLNG